MSRSVNLKLGLNGAFATRRWENPDTIVRLTGEMGYSSLEFCADQIDPFFMGDLEFRLEMAEQVRLAGARYGVEIWDLYTGVATHRFHGFSHSHPAVRRRMREWMLEAMSLAVAMGGPRLGGHVDALPVEVLDDRDAYQRAFLSACAEWRTLACVGRGTGVQALYLEQMYIPSEMPWLLDQTEEALLAINGDSGGVPVYVTVDVGHQAGQAYGMGAPDNDYLAWLRRFGAYSQVIHLQQTTPDASHHWPFTPPFNERGHIDLDRLLAALRESHEAALQSPLAAVLAPVGEQRLVLEAIPGSTKSEETVVEELTASSQYLRQWIPAEGLVWEV